MRRLWHRLREAWLYLVVCVVAGAVALLAFVALRTTLQLEKSRQQTVIDATWSVAAERIDRLDKMIVAQDNVIAANVDVGAVSSLAQRWLPTAPRETPTVRAVLVLDAASPELEIVAFVSPRPGPEDAAFRRVLVLQLLPRMELHIAPVEQLRHLHVTVGVANYLLSYWQRFSGERPYLVIAWHDVSRLVHEVMPQLYRDLDRHSRMNVIDQQGRAVFGPAIRTGGPMVSLAFPTTLYDWRLQVALLSGQDLEAKASRQRLTQIGIVGLAALVVGLATIAVVRAAVQARRLAALRSDFVANVSHELKTPLASVRMFGEMLLTGRVASDEKRREYLQIIVGESERLTSLIDNVLDFAKVERGRAAYDLQCGDVGAVARQAVETQRYRAEHLGVALVIETEPAMARIDARALELAVINLVDNALKYGVGSSRIDVRVGSSAKPKPSVFIRVVDGGPGVDVAEQARIFDRFVRGKNARALHARGSGIGLALVQEIAEAHGGTVVLESPVTGGTGAAFEIRLPLAKPDAAVS
ncbi:MAG: HAMP domain-containing histidine kinase [Myxococcales bacterium]|nr:HAMP domain-containing histidine kinase [Myxococcales bacterium]